MNLVFSQLCSKTCPSVCPMLIWIKIGKALLIQRANSLSAWITCLILAKKHDSAMPWTQNYHFYWIQWIRSSLVARNCSEMYVHSKHESNTWVTVPFALEEQETWFQHVWNKVNAGSRPWLKELSWSLRWMIHGIHDLSRAHDSTYDKPPRLPLIDAFTSANRLNEVRSQISAAFTIRLNKYAWNTRFLSIYLKENVIQVWIKVLAWRCVTYFLETRVSVISETFVQLKNKHYYLLGSLVNHSWI